MPSAPRSCHRRSAGARAAAIGILGLALAPAPAAVAHRDDPKVLDRRPPVEAPPWRAGVEGRAGVTAAEAAGGPEFPRAHVRLEAWLPLAELSPTATTGADCWGYVSGSGREYAIMTVSDAVVFVEVTDPGLPTIVASFEQPSSIWHDVKTFGTHAYAVTEGGDGIRVFDLASIDDGVVDDLGLVLEGGIPETHNVAIDPASGLLARCGGGPAGGLRLYDLADPASPSFAGAWTLRYVHDAQLRTFDAGPFAGRTLAFCGAGFNGGFVEPGLVILDVTDPAEVVEVAVLEYAGAVYAHQLWLDEAGELLYLGDEVDELQLGAPTLTRVIDVRDPAAPVELGTFGNGLESVDHNQYVRGDRLFQANYRTGLRVWDLSGNRASPTEVAFFDTFPEGDGIAFNGAWSVYPYLPSGTLIVSDMERGLFLLREEPAALRIRPVGTPPGDFVPLGGTSLEVEVEERDGATLDPESVVLVLTDEAGADVELPAEALGAGRFRAVLPAGTCGEAITYHVRAAATDGRTASFPLGAPFEGYRLRGTYGSGLELVLADDFEEDLGWTYGLPEDTATSGEWERGEPDASEAGEPGEDNPGGTGTFAAITGDGPDGGPFGFVSGGFTSLVSPVVDLADEVDPAATFAWWLVGAPGAATLEVAVSNDGGATWTVATVLEPGSGGWQTGTLALADILPVTSTMRLRFRCDALAFAEAAVDDVVLAGVACGSPCPADLDGSGAVGLDDLLAVLSTFGPCGGPPCPADLDGSGAVDFDDLVAVLAAWGDCVG